MAVFEFADELAFIFFTTVAKQFERVGFCYVGTYDGIFLLGEFEHLLFDAWEVSCGDSVLTRIDVIIESVFDGRADAELDTGEKLLESFGEKVG